MAQNSELNLVIGVVDKASSGLGKIAGGLGTLAKIGGAAFLGGAVAGVGALSAALITGIGDAREANIIMAQTEAVIKSTGGAAGVTAGHIADLSGELSAASGKSLFGDSQIQESANLLLTFTELKGGVLDAATAMSVDLAQAMGGAPADAALQLGKALNDPIAGIGALSRVGVTFTDQQKEQIKTMVEAGDVAGAQAVILAELNKEFGGSAAAAAAADGGMAQFKDRMGELAESIGAQVLPLLNQLMAWLNSPEIQTAIENIGTGLVNAVKAAAAGFTSFMTTIQPVVSFIGDNLVPILSSIAAMALTVIVPAILGMIPVFIGWATAAGAAAVATIAALLPVVAPIAAIGLAVGLLVKAWDNDWGGMRTTLTAWWTGTVQPILETVKAWLDVHLPAANAALKAAWNVAWTAIKTAVQVAYDWLSVTVWPWITAAFALLTDTVLPALSTAFGIAWDAISTAVTTVYTYFKDTVWPWLQTAFTNIKTWVGEVQTRWETAWTAIHSAVSGAKNIISGAIDTIRGLVDGAIAKINDLINLINKIPGIEIPNIPTGPGTGGGGGSGFQSIGRTPLALSGSVTNAYTSQQSQQMMGKTVNFQPGSIVINNPRNADDVQIGLQRALQSAGLA